MAAPRGNKYWKLRATHGRKPIFDSPEDLWDAACKYFEWTEKNPLYETKAFAFQGVITKTKLPKMRAMTITGLCLFLDIGFQTWQEYKVKKDFSDICARIEDVIKIQKFEGAAAEMLNPAIIARDLGLTDKQDVKHSGDVSTKITITVLENDSPPLSDDESKIN